jgi:hypothetical protein
MSVHHWKFLPRDDDSSDPKTWATRDLAVTVSRHLDCPNRVTPVGNRFGIEVPAPAPERKPRPLRPFTRRQFLRWLNKQSGWGTDLEGDGGCSAEDATADFTSALLGCPDPETQRVVAYLRSTGVTDVKGCLADYLFDVAHGKKVTS